MGFASFSALETVFKQGDTGDLFYIILSGSVDVIVREEGFSKVTTSLTCNRHACYANRSMQQQLWSRPQPQAALLQLQQIPAQLQFAGVCLHMCWHHKILLADLH